MGAWFQNVTFHAWYWMQTRWVASHGSGSNGATRCQVQPPSPPWSDETLAAARLRLPTGLLFPGRLGLDLGIDTNLAFGGCRQ